MKRKPKNPVVKEEDRHNGVIVACHVSEETKAALKKLAIRNRRTAAAEMRIAIEDRIANEMGESGAT